MEIAIIGGGASGFFSAISAKENYPEASVTIFEKRKDILSKVKVSGGGRCNLTNSCSDISELIKAYPRGAKFLKKLFHQFNTPDTMRWFESRGVELITYADNCVFPKSQNSQSIIDCLLKECKKLGISIRTQFDLVNINKTESCLDLEFKNNSNIYSFDKIIITTGGFPRLKMFNWIERLGHKIEAPIPSLFTFTMPNEPVDKLMGIVVENAQTNIQSTKIKACGPLLITHWGMSGPAILKLSSHGAKVLHQMDYNFTLQVNWINKIDNEEIKQEIDQIINAHANKLLYNYRAFNLPDKLWVHILNKIGFDSNKRWSELGKKGINKLTNALINDSYAVEGKTTFKEEFVTCGGVLLNSINNKTLESKVCPNVYFAGEILDIDAITGGYNLQAAWTTGFIAGKLK